MKELMPWQLRGKAEAYRKKLDLGEYDFTEAKVDLLASVNGRFQNEQRNMYGTKRFTTLLKDHTSLGSTCKIWIQCSSIGRIYPKFLVQLYFDLTKTLISEERINDRFGFIYPTEDYVRKSKLGIESCDCLHMKCTTWKLLNFPRKSFYKLEGKTPYFDKNIAHSKILILTKDD